MWNRSRLVTGYWKALRILGNELPRHASVEEASCFSVLHHVIDAVDLAVIIHLDLVVAFLLHVVADRASWPTGRLAELDQLAALGSTEDFGYEQHGRMRRGQHVLPLHSFLMQPVEDGRERSFHCKNTLIGAEQHEHHWPGLAETIDLTQATAGIGDNTERKSSLT